MPRITIPAYYYRQFDADFSLKVPAEGYGGWKKADLPMETDHTAVALMHAWDCGTREEYPGWHHAVEYIPRSYEISKNVFPGLLSAVRRYGMKLYHISSGEEYCRDYPGYKAVKELAGSEPERGEQIGSDPVLDELRKFRVSSVFPGEHNLKDIAKGQSRMTFLKEAEPLADEPIAKDSHQLFTLCKRDGVNHLIYAGFAIDGCLLVSPGGMIDMSRKGIMCSAIRQAVTAIENKETARAEFCKDMALWRVALLFGFVYDCDDFIDVLKNSGEY